MSLSTFIMEVPKYGQKKPDTNVSGMNNGLMDELYLCRKRLVPNQEKGISTHPPT